MKTVQLLFLSCSLVWFNTVYSQLTINNAMTPTQLVNTVLLPAASSTVVSNVNFLGVYNQSSRYQVGAFTTATTTQTQMGFNGGIVLTSGNTSEIPLSLASTPNAAAQQSRNFVSCTTGEVRKTTTDGLCTTVLNDLVVLAGPYNYYNTAVLEFDFVAAGTAVSFRYIFGSEEFTDNSGFINYQCSDYNDRFGFLLSGPGISGGQGYTNDAKNIARLANGSIVSINAVNNGVVGSSGGAPNATKCLAANPAWTNGTATAEYLGMINGTNMNGNTKVLTAYQSGLTVGQTYHIKLIIMDIADGAYDSVVYLEGGSFTTQPSNLPVELESYTGFCNQQGITLNWETQSERNNDHFTIEKYNAEHQAFELLTEVKAKGNTGQLTKYTITDFDAAPGSNLYRLSQTDVNGKAQELQTLAVLNSCAESNDYSAIFTENESIKLTYSGLRHQECEVYLYDLTGNILVNTTAHVHENETIELPIHHQLSSGVYVLKIKTETNSEEIKLINGKF